MAQAPHRTKVHEARATARKMGLPSYQGHPCKRGHAGMRYTVSGNCVDCALERRPRTGFSDPVISRKRKDAAYVKGIPLTRKDALAQGFRTYMGEACRFGHSGERHTKSSVCVECAIETARLARRPWKHNKDMDQQIRQEIVSRRQKASEAFDRKHAAKVLTASENPLEGMFK